jgi:serine protease Do
MNNDYFNNQNNQDELNNDTAKSTQDIIEGEAIILNDEPKKPRKKKHKLLRKFSKLVAAAAVFGLIAGASFQGYNTVYTNQTNKANITTNGTNKDVVAVETGTTSKTTSDVSTVVENVMPSIVAINSVMTNTTSDIFGRAYSEDVEGSGSGIIIGQNDSEILIATNNHVVENAKTVEIVFDDDTKAQATIKGTSPGNDLAVVSVSLEDLTQDTINKIKVATLGDSSSLRLGDMAIAIGNALGYGQSVTVGYISALDREVTVDDVTLEVLQTDAAINPGNSGGALLNSKGEVIGINSVKYVDDSVESVGYAIPISDAIPIINELMNRTDLQDGEKAYLGIAGKDVTDSYSQMFNMPVGVYVNEIQKDSPADKAGLKVGDIIVSVDKIKVETMTDLQDVLSHTKAGSAGTIAIKTLDNGTYVDKTINVTYEKRPSGN